MIQIIEQTPEEQLAMYMKRKKVELAKMLIECNRLLKAQMQVKIIDGNTLLVDGAFKELAEWLLINKRSVFIDADISKENKKKIMNNLGYSSNSLDD